MIHYNDVLEMLQSIWSGVSLIDPAHAQTSPASPGFDFMGLAPLVIIFIAFYFFLIRPQQKKAQQQRDMLSALHKGDRVVTAGGIIGRVHSIDGAVEVVIEVEGGSQLRLLKSAIVEKIPSGAALKVVEKVSETGDAPAKTKPRRPAPKKTTKRT